MKTEDSFSKPQMSLLKPIQLVAKVSSRFWLGDRPLDGFRVIIFVIVVVVFRFIILKNFSFWLYRLVTKSFSLPRSFPCIRITLSLGIMLALRLYGSYQSERSIVVIALIIVLEPSLCPLSLTITSPHYFPHSRVGISLEVILALCLLLTFLLDRPRITTFLCLMLEPSFFFLGVTTKGFCLLPDFSYPGRIKASRFRAISCLLSTLPIYGSIKTSLSMIWTSSLNLDSISARLLSVISPRFEGAWAWEMAHFGQVAAWEEGTAVSSMRLFTAAGALSRFFVWVISLKDREKL